MSPIASPLSHDVLPLETLSIISSELDAVASVTNPNNDSEKNVQLVVSPVVGGDCPVNKSSESKRRRRPVKLAAVFSGSKKDTFDVKMPDVSLSKASKLPISFSAKESVVESHLVAGKPRLTSFSQQPAGSHFSNRLSRNVHTPTLMSLNQSVTQQLKLVQVGLYYFFFALSSVVLLFRAIKAVLDCVTDNNYYAFCIVVLNFTCSCHVTCLLNFGNSNDMFH